jgi:hypothetical protein
LTVYLDTSVAVSLLVEDAHTERARRLVATSANLTISDLTSAEFSSAIAIRLRSGHLGADQARAAFALFDNWCAAAVERVEVMSSDLRAAERIIRTLQHPIRAPDATHLAITGRLDASLATYDGAMVRAARSLGLAVADDRT